MKAGGSVVDPLMGREGVSWVRELRFHYGARVAVGGRVMEPRQAAGLVAPLLVDETSEVLAVLCLDAKHKALGWHVIGRGTVDRAMGHPRDVFLAGIVTRAAGVIVVHNHPSGEAGMSEEDVAFGRRLKAGGEILGIDLLDVMVVARNDAGEVVYSSMRESGRL